MDDNHSKVVTEHIDVFYAKIFPEFKEYFKDETLENVTIVCGYGWAVSKRRPIARGSLC